MNTERFNQFKNRPLKRMSTSEIFENDENVSPTCKPPKEVKRKRPVASRSMPSILNESQEFGTPETFWDVLIEKDQQCRTSPIIFSQHLKLKPYMRLVLYDWLMNVCSELALHRETFHLAISFVDKYLVKTGGMPQNIYKIQPGNLQLLGISCLLIATKVEEIYPPKVEVLADYTDGACSTKQLRGMEEVVLEVLDWNCTYMTAIQWLSFYLQMMWKQESLISRSSSEASTSFEKSDCSPSHDDCIVEQSFTVPVLARDDFVECARVLDLCMTSVRYMNYTYSELAAAVVLFTFEPTDAVELIIGYTQSQLSDALHFVEPYIRAAKDEAGPGVSLPDPPTVNISDRHNIQISIKQLENLIKDLEKKWIPMDENSSNLLR